MRAYALVIVGALFAFPASAFSQSIDVGARGVEVEGLQHGRSVGREDCAEMRKACLNKRELGEQGQGNCRRYRRMCGLD
jgi:hypothetical protein